MLSTIDEYIINDITAMRYTYDSLLGTWRSEWHRKNSIKRIVTVTRLRVTEEKIIAFIQHWEGHPRTHTMDDLSLIDSRRIEFNDNGFLEHLKSLKSD